ncbi:thioesterase II family protein [Streptomyces sp. 24-1644]|uniref:thioesterase II family protein n=1 Tax=Streptomyces sp. 24-1644 TaxID=3457315 RepID=UPI003FA7410A
MSLLRRLSAGEGTSRILCLPYAGGGGSVYESWTKTIPAHVDVWVPDLPGREHRMLDEPVEDLHELVAALADALGEDPVPTSLFGHSLGSLVAFELARELEARSLPVRCLVASGMSAPRTLTPRPAPTDAQILADLRRMGVAPDELFSQPDLVELLLPGLRADYTMALGYTYREGPKLSCGIFAVGGTDDAHVPLTGLAAWSEETVRACETRMWEGGHMYLLDHAEDLAAFVTTCHTRSLGE